MKTTIEVTDCRDCPFRKTINAHEENWHHCSHKDNGQPPYGNILWVRQSEFTSIPDWCPIKEK